MERSNNLLRAYESERWLSCTPSARLEEGLSQTKDMGDEKTAVRGLSDIMLRQYLKGSKKAGDVFSSSGYGEDVRGYAELFSDHAIEVINNARAVCGDINIYAGEEIDFSPWIPGGFGSPGLIIAAKGVLEVMEPDLSEDINGAYSCMMKILALGALNSYGYAYDIRTIRMTLCQVKVDNYITLEISLGELLRWGEEYLKPRAQMALKGQGEFIPGYHCRGCRARFTCRARARENLKLEDYGYREPPLLEDSEIIEVLKSSGSLECWAQDVYDYTVDMAEKQGRKWPGWRLVEGRSTRRFSDETAALKALLDAGYSKDYIFEKRLMGISSLERILGRERFEEILGPYIIRIQGRPVLVPEEKAQV